ncbi:MAG: hypothetical protein ACOCUS_02515 [Polyangiales bacterium]
MLRAINEQGDVWHHELDGERLRCGEVLELWAGTDVVDKTASEPGWIRVRYESNCVTPPDGGPPKVLLVVAGNGCAVWASPQSILRKIPQ